MIFSLEALKNKVPKWSKAAFQDKFNIMKTKLEKTEDTAENEEKFQDLDENMAKLQKRLREGSAMDTGTRGQNRVSALAEELFKEDEEDSGSVAGSGISEKPAFVPAKSGSEICHFCQKRVYVVERMSAEGKFFHRSCFRCDYCNILLRLGSYVYHREGVFGGKMTFLLVFALSEKLMV